ncbi:MAG TPA: hypothetical protein VIY08_04695 [Candidatus Nitrosocosmicus sp.]
MVNNRDVVIHKTEYGKGKKMAMIFYKTNHAVILIEVVNVFDPGFSWFRRGLQINYFPT